MVIMTKEESFKVSLFYGCEEQAYMVEIICIGDSRLVGKVRVKNRLRSLVATEGYLSLKTPVCPSVWGQLFVGIPVLKILALLDHLQKLARVASSILNASVALSAGF